MLPTSPVTVISEPGKIFALLRAALLLNSSFEYTENEQHTTLTLTHLEEKGVSKALNVTKLTMLVGGENRISFRTCGASSSFSFLVGDLRVSFSSAISAVDGNILSLNCPNQLTVSRVRRSARRENSNRLTGWGSIKTERTIYPARLELKDYSENGLGLIITLPETVESLNKALLNGMLTVNSIKMSIDNAVVHYATLIASIHGWKVFKVGCAVNAYSKALNKHDEKGDESNPNMRHAARVKNTTQIKIRSLLAPNHKYSATINDVSISGLSCQLARELDTSAFPLGAPVEMADVGIKGTVVDREGMTVRIAFDLNDTLAFERWFSHISELLHPSVETHIDFFEQAAASFASSGGTKQSFLRSISLMNLFSKAGITTLNKNPNWIQAWLERNKYGSVIGHISCIRYGDNLWYAGDLWGSQLEPIHRDFARRFLDNFISYALANKPYPKTLGIWKFDHPYWKKMDHALAAAFKHYIFEESLCYKIPLLDHRTINDSESEVVIEIKAQDTQTINRIMQQLIENGTSYFAELMGFHEDNFGAPRLRDIIQKAGYSFSRHYFEITSNSSKFLAIISFYPPGTSIQFHQETIWLFPLTRNEIDPQLINCITAALIPIALKIGVLPAYLKIATKHQHPHFDAPMRLVIGDPRMWKLA